MKPTSEMIQRLNSIFSRLWGNRGGVPGSWGASSHGYHPTFIRRGALLLKGQTSFDDLFVLSPADAPVTPILGDPRYSCNVFPEVDGKVIDVSRYNDGPWWDVLLAEIPKMEADLDASEAKAKEKAEAEESQKRKARADELEAARKSFA